MRGILDVWSMMDTSGSIMWSDGSLQPLTMGLIPCGV